MTVGGGVEAEDESVEAALHREVFEELGGTVEGAELVYLITDELDGGIGVQHIFAAMLVSMDLAARTGSEFGKPERGGYEVVRVPFTAVAVRELNLMPPQLGEFIASAWLPQSASWSCHAGEAERREHRGDHAGRPVAEARDGERLRPGVQPGRPQQRHAPGSVTSPAGLLRTSRMRASRAA